MGHQLIKKLQHLNITPPLIHWIYNFLSNRPQSVKIGAITSSTIITNTGAPQGCVLSPFLYTLYTNDCQSTTPNTTFYKYADDTAIVGLLSGKKDTAKQTITAYHQSITDFSQWCSDNFLQLNVDKTKELVIHASKPPSGLNHISIHGQSVEQVSTFKYLGLTIDNKLNFNEHATITQKRAQQRLYIIRKLKSLSVAPHLLLLLYKSIIQPLLLYCSPCFFNILTVTSKNKLIKISNLASKIIHLPTPSLTDANDKAITRLAHTIANSPDHPLNQFFTFLPSGRRYRTVDWQKAHFKKSFVPSAITALNKLL